MPDHPLPNVFQVAAFGMGLLDLDRRWLQVNAALCGLLGYSEPELLKARFDDLAPEPDEGLFEKVRTEGDNACHELKLRHRSGSVLWISLHLSLLRDDDDRPRCFFAQLEDITALREAEEVQDRIFNLPVALHYAAGFDGYFKKLSPSWEIILGHSIDKLLSIPFIDLVHPEDREQTVKEFRGVKAGSNTFLFENRYRHADGSYRWLLWTSITTPGEELVYGVALDYTRRKEAELKVTATIAELERVLADLHASQDQISKLRAGLLKVCAWTKRVEHEGRWIPVDEFLSEYLKLNVTHGISDEAVKEFLAGIPDAERMLDPKDKGGE